MDSNDIERERGITILAKNTSAFYEGVKINIVDTPGHADFGGEVERVLKMVNGVLLLVDAFEGPMPQTRFVLQKALELNHKVIIVVNKIDRPDARPDEVTDEVLELLLELNATDEQLDSPIVYCSGRAGTASLDPAQQGEDLKPLFDTILSHIDPPEGDPAAPLQVLVSSIEYNDYVGRMAIGRIENGELKKGMDVALVDYHDESLKERAKINTIYQFAGLKREAVDSASAGDIVCFSGIERCQHRQHHLCARKARGHPLRQDLRADGGNDLLGQQQPVCRAGKATSSLPATCATACSASSRRMCPSAWRRPSRRIPSACLAAGKCICPS